MSYRIDPNACCAVDGCTRPKAIGERLCSQCSRLARATGSELLATVTLSTPAVLEAPRAIAGQPPTPRCVAYLSMAGDVITLELTGEPRFTEADVAVVVRALRNRRDAA